MTGGTDEERVKFIITPTNSDIFRSSGGGIERVKKDEHKSKVLRHSPGYPLEEDDPTKGEGIVYDEVNPDSKIQLDCIYTTDLITLNTQ